MIPGQHPASRIMKSVSSPTQFSWRPMHFRDLTVLPIPQLTLHGLVVSHEDQPAELNYDRIYNIGIKVNALSQWPKNRQIKVCNVVILRSLQNEFTVYYPACGFGRASVTVIRSCIVSREFGPDLLLGEQWSHIWETIIAARTDSNSMNLETLAVITAMQNIHIHTMFCF